MHLKAPNPSPVTHFPQRGHTYNHKAAPPNSAPSMSLWGHYHSKYHWSPNHLSTTGAFVFHPYLSGIGGWALFRVLQFPGMCSLFGQALFYSTASLLGLLTLDRRGSCFLIVPYLNLPLTFLVFLPKPLKALRSGNAVCFVKCSAYLGHWNIYCLTLGVFVELCKKQ